LERAAGGGPAYGRLRQQVSECTHGVTEDLCGCTGRAADTTRPRFEVRELGEIDTVSRASLSSADTSAHGRAAGSALRELIADQR
jgi:hypothetical protein